MHALLRNFVVGLALVCLVSVIAAAEGATVYFLRAGEVTPVDLADFSQITGSVAYQGPVMSADDENWKEDHVYSGPTLREIVEGLGGLAEGETLGVVASDGWYKVLPKSVVYGESVAGDAILATSIDGTGYAEWDDAPTLVFLPEDGRFSNDDMLSALGPELAHYFGESPSTTGMMVKGVLYLVVNYDGEPLGLPAQAPVEEAVGAPEGVVLTLIKGGATLEYTLADLEALDVLTAPGTFTNSAGVDYTATYTGVPLTTLIGNVPADATVRVTASDGYSMNYAVDMLADRSGGTWILAFRENGEYMPLDPGNLRIVQVGEDDPHFTSSLSARMVEQIEVRGIYEAYTLLLKGAVDRLFAREELEAGIGCPCHTATVTATSKGETHTYTGLPLWRLIAYVDDDLFPTPDQGIHYDDEDFNDALAAEGYTITLTASDGYSQTVTSDVIARDDRFIVAFKVDGVFLDPERDGYMRFVYDDTVALPEDARLKSVKFLAEITLSL
jgi:hypothetical protein